MLLESSPELVTEPADAINTTVSELLAGELCRLAEPYNLVDRKRA